MTEVARADFVNAMAPSLLAAAFVISAAAVLVVLFLPARAGDARETQEGALDGIASLTFAEAEGVLERTAADAHAEVGT